MSTITEEKADKIIDLLERVAEVLPIIETFGEMVVRKTEADEAFNLNKGTLSKNGKTQQQVGKRVAVVSLKDLVVYNKKNRRK